MYIYTVTTMKAYTMLGVMNISVVHISLKSVQLSGHYCFW